jgi:zinc finger HIT domain-containing protein 3
VRRALAANPRLPELLRSVDQLRGEEREDALQHALGVSSSDTRVSVRADSADQSDEDVKALRSLAEAIEAAVRGGKQDTLGLEWGD